MYNENTQNKMYSKNTLDKQQKYFNKRVSGARVVRVDGTFCTEKNRIPTFQLTLHHHGMCCIA